VEQWANACSDAQECASSQSTATVHSEPIALFDKMSSARAVVLIAMAETPYGKWLQQCSPDSGAQKPRP
jgi:uncharacterized protein (DUF1499 family)